MPSMEFAAELERLSARESTPLVSHLVSCSACRNDTAQLICLAEAIEPEAPFALAEANPEASVFRRFFDSLRERVLHLSGETDAVFAYHETDAPDNNQPGPTNHDNHLH
jgi:hypothetical protein